MTVLGAAVSRGRFRPGWLTPARVRLLVGAISALGYSVAIILFVVLYNDQPGRIYDSTLYWNAGKAVLDGGTPYGAIAIGTTSKAFFYPPILAQAFAPFTLIPEPVFTWGWRFLNFACLIWLAGGLRNGGLWMWFPLTLQELANPNVTLLCAVATIVALRGRPWLLPFAGVAKFGPMLVAPFIWFRRRQARRELVIATAVVAAACAVSFAVSPGLWSQYVGQMTSQTAVSTQEGVGLISILPSAGADFALRMCVGAVLVGLALVVRTERLAFIGATIAVPAFYPTRLLPLIALPQLRGREPATDPTREHVPQPTAPTSTATAAEA